MAEKQFTEKIFDAQSNYGWGLSLNMTGKAPAVAKRIWDSYSDALAYVNDFNESAVEGLTLSVVADTDPKKNGVYFVEKIGTSKEVDGVVTPNYDGILTKIGGTDTQTAEKYSSAVALSNSLIVGQLIKVLNEETITTGEGEEVVSNTYKAGFYIVEAPGVISILATSSGSTDEIGDLNTRVASLESGKVDVSSFNTYKSEIASSLETKANSTDLASHTGNNNVHVTSEEKIKWNNTLDNAKAYTNEEITKIDGRVSVLEAIDHDKLAQDAASAAVATVLDGAPEKFDTLKEIADWIAEENTAEDAISLVNRVSALESIDHDAYKGADTAVLNEAKQYVDGKVDDKFDPKGSAATAKEEAIAAAKADAETKLAEYYTKTEVDDLLEANSTADKAYAKTYTDALFDSITFAENGDIDNIFK